MTDLSLVDWTTYIPAAVTGIVGMAGIGGSIWSARIAGKNSNVNLLRGIDAQKDRARESEKRRLYAASLAAFNDMTTAYVDFVIDNRSEGQDEYRLARKTLYDAQSTMNRALEELMLIAPKDVAIKAVDLSNHFRTLIVNFRHGESPDIKTAGLMRTVLVRAMREDLGEANW